MAQHQVNDLESVIYQHLEVAAKLADKDRQHDLGLHSIESKSYHVEKAAEAAEVAGWSKKDIAKRLIEVIEKHGYNISRRLVYDVCSPLGYSNAWGEEKSAESAQNNSSINSACEQENEPLIALMEKEIDTKKAQIAKLRIEHFLSKIPANERRELLYLYERHNTFISQEWDGRQDVSERQYLTLYVASTMSNSNNATKVYIRHVKEWEPLTGKQYHKLMSGKARLVHPVFEPKNARDAVDLGYYGKPCQYAECADPACSYGNRANVEKCAKCGNTKLIVKGCWNWRQEIDKEASAIFKVHCCNCLKTYEPMSMRLPVSSKIVLDNSMSTHQG